MNTNIVETSRRAKLSPYYVAVPIMMVIFALYAKTFLPFGVLSIVGGALIGALWAIGLGFVAQRLARREEWRVWLANAPLFLSVVAMGLSIGGSLMYGFMMSAALNESSTTYAVLSALMKPAVPYYIIINSLMELFLVALLVFWNWDVGPNRRTLILIGAILYIAMRIWTYLVFAETRVEITQHTLSQADIEWFKQTLATDFRVVLNLITYVILLFAAFLSVNNKSSPAGGSSSTKIVKTSLKEDEMI